MNGTKISLLLALLKHALNSTCTSIFCDKYPIRLNCLCGCTFVVRFALHGCVSAPRATYDYPIPSAIESNRFLVERIRLGGEKIQIEF